MSEEVYLVVDLNSICRFCLQPNGILSNITEGSNDLSLVQQFTEITCLKIALHDDTPKKVCHKCRYKIELCYKFRKMALESQHSILSSFGIQDTVEQIIGNNGVCKQKNENTIKSNANLLLHEDTTNDTSSKPTKLRTYSSKKRNRPKSIASPYPTMAEATKNHQCLLCLDQCTDENNLEIHVYKHLEGTELVPYNQTTDRDILCKGCDKVFPYRFNYLVHLREHLQLKPFRCLDAKCDCAFTSNTALKNHIQLHAERNFVCSICDSGFKRKSDLKLHHVIHLDEGKVYFCSECGIVCKNRITFRAHMKKHETSPRHKCNYCSKTFYSPSELQRHTLSHAESKQFKCTNCNRSYCSKSALFRHQKTCENIINENRKDNECHINIGSRHKCSMETEEVLDKASVESVENWTYNKSLGESQGTVSQETVVCESQGTVSQETVVCESQGIVCRDMLVFESK